MLFTTLILFALVATLVQAHGFLASVTIDGKLFQGNIPNTSPIPSAIRQINSVNPIKPSTDRAVNCGADAQTAEQVLDANPGSQLVFDWHGGTDGTWPHDTGPMMTYMALCGNTTCDKFDAIGAKWFKINEDGRIPGDKDGKWMQSILFNGGKANATIPSSISPGDYLVRHEIIALHNAVNPGGAEFYPSCTQIRIGNNSNPVVQPNQTVALPGAYSDTDPGILVNAYDSGAAYIFPGPPISNVVAATNTTSSSHPPSSSSSSKSCLRPRRISRIMRRYVRAGNQILAQ